MRPGSNSVAGGSGRVERVEAGSEGGVPPAVDVHAANAATTSAAAAQRAATSAMLIVSTIPGGSTPRL
jgi:hypothetical protein